MSVKGNKELVQEVYKAWNAAAGDGAKFRAMNDKYFASGYTYHNPRADYTREEMIKGLGAFATAFPDASLSIDDLVAEGNKVVSRYTFEGTHKGTFMGAAATGKKVVFKGVLIQTVAGGRIVEDWEILDELGVMTQLGAIPSASPKR